MKWLYESNIKENMPRLHDALSILDQEIDNAKKSNYRLLKIVHGYGSTGRGGKIRSAVRKRLNFLKANNLIKGYIVGENWEMFNEEVQDLMKQGFVATSDSDMNQNNIGITVVILKK